jgi:hypothetical protein
MWKYETSVTKHGLKIWSFGLKARSYGLKIEVRLKFCIENGFPNGKTKFRVKFGIPKLLLLFSSRKPVISFNCAHILVFEIAFVLKSINTKFAFSHNFVLKSIKVPW